jgi:hypothetical protein
MTDFSKTLIRCSSLGAILTEPQAKAAKDAGELSKTAKTALIGTYIREVYGREKDITTKQMSKGIIGEDKGIELLSRHQGEIYSKNETRYNNEYLTGHPDIITQDNRIIDTKLSFDLWTFLPNITESLDKGYYYQLQGYMALTGAQSGSIAYVLVDTPQEIIEQEKYYLLKRMNCISEESPEYIEAAAGLEINMIYPDIPLEQRVLIFKVDRDDEVIDKIYEKIRKCRVFLQEFSLLHDNLNK